MYSKLSVHKSLCEYGDSRFFLQVMGFYWSHFSNERPQDSFVWRLLIKLWYVLLRISMVYFMFHFHIAFNFMKVLMYKQSKNAEIELPIIYTVLTLQGIVLLPSLLYFDKNSIHEANDVGFYDGAMKQCYIYFWVTFVSVIIYVLLMSFSGGFQDGGYAFFVADLIVGLSVTCVLTINIFFIILDCKCSLGKITHLFGLRRSTDLLEEYQANKKAIRAIQKKHEFKNNAMLFVALLNVLAALVTLFLQPKLRPNLPQNNTFALLGFCCLYMKELFFVIIVFKEVSGVNEQVDKLHKYIAGDIGTDSNPTLDQQRRDILTIIPIQPISYKLGNIRITKVIFVRSMLGFLSSFLVAVIKLFGGLTTE